MINTQYDGYYGDEKKKLSLRSHNPSRILKRYKSKNGTKLILLEENYHVRWTCG